MSEILILKPTAKVDTDTLQMLREAGVAVIWSDDPDAARLLRSTAEVEGSTLLRCALAALASKSDGSYAATANRSEFVNLLAASMKEAK